MHGSSDGALPQAAADVWAALRAKAPRVHCITNSVAQAFTANILLAAGAVPSMTIAPAEIGAFTEAADALLVNLGTFDGERREAVHTALEVVRHHGKPWVLDPVLIDRSPSRAGFAKSLLARKPAVLRLNAAEFQTLGGVPDGPGTMAFAKESATVVALSGATDLIGDATRLAAVHNGHPHMARVTAMGCAASALTAACLAVSGTPFVCGVTALLALGVAGEIAGETATGPGSFAAGIIDALFNLDAATLRKRAKVS
ncbi:MAG: hydroxyethylthiazole kinase [Pseudolabrys sp.]